MVIRVSLDTRWRVRLVGELELPLDAEDAWRSMHDFRRFACMDMFHRRLVLDHGEPRAGARFDLEHAFGPLRVTRIGKILHWNEGRSYAFSDLSRRGSRVGFPHVYIYELIPISPARCRFRVEVRGLWTARPLGRTLTRIWLGWVLLKTVITVHNAFLLDRRRLVSF